MPAALDVDRDQVKMMVIQYGVREAARLCELSENTVLAWSNRFGWLENLPRSIPLPPTVIQPAIGAIKPVEALAAAMLTDAVQGRASGLRITRRTLARYERMDDDELIVPEVVSGVHQTIKSAAVVGGYAANSRPDPAAMGWGSRDDGLIIDAEPAPLSDGQDDPAFQ